MSAQLIATERLVATDDHIFMLSGGRFDGSSREHLHRVFKAASAQHAKNLVVHFHGGLIDKADGLAAAERLIPIYQATGAFPIFFIWESGWREIIARNIPAILREPIFERIVAAVSRASKAKITETNGTNGARSIKSLPPRHEIISELKKPSPFADIKPDLPPSTSLSEKETLQFENLLKDDVGFKAAVSQAVKNARDAKADKSIQISPELLSDDRSGSEASRAVLSTGLMIARGAFVLGRVIHRFARKRHHGFYLTIVEEVLRGFYLGSVGKFFWDQMKKDIDAAFGFSDECGGTAFADELSRILADEAAPKVTFVAHSAGSIYACRLLKHLQAIQLPPSVRVNLILIAAAIDMKTLAETLRAVGSRVDGFRSFGMSDELERQDELFSKFFPGSLLYFVSGVLEEEADMPLAGMERFYTSDFNEPGLEYVAAVRQFDVCGRSDSFIWAPSNGSNGRACDMRQHGGWIDATATVNSVQHIISNGFGPA